MYPHVTQFETRDQLVRQELELRFSRRAARRALSGASSMLARQRRRAIVVGPNDNDLLFDRKAIQS